MRTEPVFLFEYGRHALGVGLMSGYSSDELRQSGAIRVYEDPAGLLVHIDEVSGRG
jgi:hypothetical protein